MSPSTSDLLDERPELVCCQLPFRFFCGQHAFSGSIQTVSCLDDNQLVRDLLGEAGEGRVLVVDGHGSLAVALIGEAMASRAAAGGWAGVIANGGVRDVDALASLRFGLIALGSVPRRAKKSGIGVVGVAVSFGGATFEPGGTVWVDHDGVVVARPPK